MKTKHILIPILSAVLAGGLAAQQGPQRGPSADRRPPAPDQMLERFDLNGDGVIDLTEIETVTSENRERRMARLESRQNRISSQAQQNRPGPQARPNREDAPRQNTPFSNQNRKPDGSRLAEVVVERFDDDGDGLLSAEELQEFFALRLASTCNRGGWNGPRGQRNRY